MKQRIATIVLLLPLVMMIGTGAVKRKAPNFTLKTAAGKSVELAKLKGKVVVVNFWATWCGPCRAEIPAFMDVYGKYKGRGLEIVGISVDQGGWSDVKPFVDRYGVTYPVVLGTESVVRQYGGVDAIPSTFVVDKDGYLVSQHVGSMSRQAFEALVSVLL